MIFLLTLMFFKHFVEKLSIESFNKFIDWIMENFQKAKSWIGDNWKRLVDYMDYEPMVSYTNNIKW